MMCALMGNPPAKAALNLHGVVDVDRHRRHARGASQRDVIDLDVAKRQAQKTKTRSTFLPADFVS